VEFIINFLESISYNPLIILFVMLAAILLFRLFLYILVRIVSGKKTVKPHEKYSYVDGWRTEESESSAIIAAYAEETEATGWFGPEVLFGLSYAYLKPGQSMLDLGIGTGLGSDLFRKAGLKVYGLDISPQMLNACRSKGIKTVKLHDLTTMPYPFDSTSMDHAVCTGVMNFLSDLSPLFIETARILRPDGLFAFVVGDRAEDEPAEMIVGSEHTNSEETVTMYLHSPKQIDGYLEENGFSLMRNLVFTVYLDSEKTMATPARAYLARKS
jgi:SAM-dependent methyltransferase